MVTGTLTCGLSWWSDAMAGVYSRHNHRNEDVKLAAWLGAQPRREREGAPSTLHVQKMGTQTATPNSWLRWKPSSRRSLTHSNYISNTNQTWISGVVSK